jgi:hypothetical protein
MMSVRKAAGTTFWLVLLFVGTALLLPVIRQSLPYDVFYHFDARFSAHYSIGGFYPFVVNLAIWVIIIAGTLDAILNNKFHFQLLGCYSVIIVLGIPAVIAALIPSVTQYMFWGVYQLIAILGTYWAFRKITKNNKVLGQKLIPFIKEIKIGGGAPRGHISDHYATFGMSLILITVQAIQIISLIVFAIANWQMFI